ncbi:MAG: MBL fold metallo-hydrolase [Syntrophales bacterium]|nr:MBL fold metallo-hydrolase [Syntrophales bacterium]
MKYLWGLAVFMTIVLITSPIPAYETDIIETPEGAIKITFIGHASLVMEFEGKIIHIDPVGQYGDYARLPKADLILVTHEHYDHFDPRVIKDIRKKETIIIGNGHVTRSIPEAVTLKNGEEKTVWGFNVLAVPAYNIVHFRAPGVPFHPKGEGNGYLISLGKTRVYIAGDTENVPEMKNLKGVDIAFLPMNLPYTMTPEMVADAVRAFRPRILYPYHYGDTNISRLVELLKDEKGIEIRIRKMK